MPTYEQTMTIPASAQQIYDFIADVENLPKYLPTTQEAHSQGTDRVVVEGSAAGHPYHADGYLRPNPNEMSLAWGADEGFYSGELEVEGESDESQVTVRLMFKERPDADGRGPTEADIREGLQKALESIHNHVTGQGGKVEPSSAT